MEKLPSTLTELLDKEMDRKQFIAYVGGAALAVAGLSKIIGFVKGKPGDKKVASKGGGGYGSSPYGR